MAEVGSAQVAIVPTFKGFRSKVSDEAEDAGKESGGRFSGAFKGAAAALVGVFAVDKLFSGLGAAVSEAANLEQSVGAINTVFKDSGAQMNAWADQAAVDVGLSKNEFNELGTLIGSQLKNGGTAMEDLAPKTKDLITLGADLSSMFGGTTADAVGALSSALKGERDPIERFGVSLNQAKIDAEAAALGFEKVDGALSSEANQAATLSLIMKQTADAHGNFGRETDTLAHKQQVLNAQLANGKSRIGTELLPVVAAFTGILSSALGPAIDKTVGGIRRVVGAGQGLYDLFAKGDFTGALATAFNIEEDSKVVGVLFRIRDAALEVVGGFRAFGNAWRENNGDITSSGFPGFMERIANALREAVGGVRAFFFAFAAGGDEVTSSGFAGFLESLGLAARKLFDSMAPAISGLVPQLVSLWSAFSPLQMIFAAIQPLLPAIAGMFGQLASTISGTLVSVLTTLVPMLVELSGILTQTLGGVLVAIMPALTAMFMTFGSALQQIIPVVVGIVAAIIPLVGTLLTQLAPIITQLVTSILPPVVSIFGNIVNAIGPLVATIAGLLIPVIGALLPIVVTVFGVVADIITSVMRVIQGVIQVVTGVISGNWAKVWTGILNIVGGVFDLIVSLVSGAIQLVLSVIINGLNAVFSFWSSMWSGIVRYLGTSVRSIIDGAQGMLSDLLGFFGGIGNRVVGALGNIGGVLLNSGRALIQGFINGITSMAGAIGDAVGGVMQAARDFFPFSPAKKGPFSGRGYTSYSGKALAKDFAGGMTSEQGTIAGAASRLMSAASLSMGPDAAGVAGSAAARVAGAGQVNYFTINQVDDPIGTAHAVARRQRAVSV